MLNVVDSIQNNIPFTFVKYGDGEYFAAIQSIGHNCDGTPYTKNLGDSLVQSFKYFTQFDNVFVGKRQEEFVFRFFSSLSNRVNWEDFHLFMFNSASEFYNRLPIYRAIRNATQQKLYVCNETMVEESKKLLNIDSCVVVNSQNWFEQNYSTVLKSIQSLVKDPSSIIILFSAGMGAKVLMADVLKLFPLAILIDIGSALDLLCGGRKSRDYHQTFKEEDMMQFKLSLEEYRSDRIEHHQPNHDNAL